MIIKSLARHPRDDREHAYDCWYEPFDVPEIIQQSVDFSLSQPGVTELCTTIDITIPDLFLQACQNYELMVHAKQEEPIEPAAQREAIKISE